MQGEGKTHLQLVHPGPFARGPGLAAACGCVPSKKPFLDIPSPHLCDPPPAPAKPNGAADSLDRLLVLVKLVVRIVVKMVVKLVVKMVVKMVVIIVIAEVVMRVSSLSSPVMLVAVMTVVAIIMSRTRPLYQTNPDMTVFMMVVIMLLRWCLRRWLWCWL